MILNIHAPNDRDSKYKNQKLIEPQENTDNKRMERRHRQNYTQIEDFNTSFLGIGRQSHPKITTQDFIIFLSIIDRTTGKII